MTHRHFSLLVRGAVVPIFLAAMGFVYVGIGVVLFLFAFFRRRVIPMQGSTMEGVALYWHFVDSIWIVLFPLLYLGGRS